MMGGGRGRARTTIAVALTTTIALGGALTAQADFVRAPGSPYATGNDPVSLTRGSFDGDALTDLAVVNATSSTVSVFDQVAGSGGFAAGPGSGFAVGTGPSFAAAADYNGDGRQDLAVSNFQSGDVSIRLRQPDGTFAAEGTAIDTLNRPGAIASADFNGDGRADLAVASWDSAVVEIWLRKGSNDGFTLVTGTGQPATTGPSGVHPRFVAVGDLDGTGGPDLAVSNIDSDNLAVLLNSGGGAFTPAAGSPIAVGDGPYSVVVAPLDGDALADVAVTNSLAGSVTVLHRTGAGTFTPLSGSPFAVGASPIGLAAGDFDLSGRLDLVTADSADSTLTILRNDGSTFSRQAAISTLPDNGPYDVTTGQFNDGDVRTDIAFTRVTASPTTDNLNVLLNHAAPLAVTGEASGIAQTSATLNGTVNPRGEDTDAHFEYGTTPAYGSTAPAGGNIPVGADAADHGVSRGITGLAPSTEYHYRLVASSPGGSFAGGDHTFTTLAPDVEPPASTVGGPPQAYLVAPDTIAAGTPTTLSAEGSSPSGSLTYKLDLDGSGQYATDLKQATSLQTTFATPGTVRVGLQVTDDQGRTDTVRRTVHVTAPPQYSFTFSPSDPDVGEKVRFTVRQVLDDPTERGKTLVKPLPSDALSTMTFGDGTKLSGKVDGLLVRGRAANDNGNFTHRYSRAGTYQVHVTVDDGSGYSRGVDVTVPVGQDPVAYRPAISTPALTVTQGSCVGFTNSTAYALSDKDVGPVTRRDVNPKNQIVTVKPPNPRDVIFGGDITPKVEVINPVTIKSAVVVAGSPWGHLASPVLDLDLANAGAFGAGRSKSRQAEPTVTTDGTEACQRQREIETTVANASASNLVPPGGDKGWRTVQDCSGGQKETSYQYDKSLEADLVTEDTVTTRHTWFSVNQWDFGDGTKSGPEGYLPSYQEFHPYDRPGTFTVALSTTFPRKLADQIGQWNAACATRPFNALKPDDRFATRSTEIKLRVKGRYDRIKSRGMWMTTPNAFTETDLPGVYEASGPVYVNTRHKSTAYDPKTGLYNNPDDVGNANGILVVTPTTGPLKIVPDKGEIIGAANLAWGSSYDRRMALGAMPLKIDGTPGLIIPEAGAGGTHDFGIFNDPPASLGSASKAPDRGKPFHINWAHVVLREGGGGRLEINVHTPPPIGPAGGNSDQTLVRDVPAAGRRAKARGVFDDLDVEIPAVTLVPGVLSFDGGKLSHHPSKNEDIDPPWKASGKLTIFKVGVDMSPDHTIEDCPVRGGLGFKESGALVNAGAIVTGLNIPIPSYPAPIVSLSDPALEVLPPTDETPLDLFGCLTLQDYPSGDTFQIQGCVAFLSGGTGTSIDTKTPIAFCPTENGTQRFALTDTNSSPDTARPGRRILRGVVLRVGGALRLGPSKFKIAQAYLEYRSDPFAVEARAHIGFDIVPDHVSLDGDLGGYMRGKDDWGITGEVRLKQDILCPPVIGCIDPGISMAMSSRGMGGCVDAYGFSVGASVDFRDASLHPHIPGCDLGKLEQDLGIKFRGLPGYDTMLRSAGRAGLGAAQTAVAKLGGGAAYTMLIVRGTDESPQVQVHDPNGKLVLDDTGAAIQGLQDYAPRKAPKAVDLAAQMPAAAEAQQAHKQAPQGIIHNDAAQYHDQDVDMRHTTIVLIRNALQGNYTITAKDGSAPIEAISHADALAQSVAKAAVVSSVAGSKAAQEQKMLSLKAALQQHEAMTISEEARNLSHKLAVIQAQAQGKARAAAITRHIRFTPAAGDRGTRTIVGVITRDGVFQRRIVLARYKAPGAPRAGRVKGLRVSRTATSVVVRFAPARAAVRHLVRATLGGRVIEVSAGAKARRVVISTALARRGGHVTVRAIGPLQVPGPAATRRVKAIRAHRPKHFVL